MTLRNQIEARTNAANTSAAWKHLKLSERERRKHHYKHETPTARDCLALLLMSPMRRGRGGCCWLLWWLKSWNGLANKLQNVCFLKHARMACIQTALHELAAPAFKARGNSALKHCFSSFSHFYNFLKGVWQCDTSEKHLPKFVMRYIWEISACCCKQDMHVSA